MASDARSVAIGRAVRWGLLASSLGVVGGFLVSPNLDNTTSDNYRYLVFLLVPASTGFGLWLAGWTARGRSSLVLAWGLTLGFAALLTVDSARWYARFGWVDASWRPVRVVVDDPALAWLDRHPEVSLILGDYWDVYRLAFLTGGRVLPVPYPQYPDRFPSLRGEPAAGRSRIILARRYRFGPEYQARALAAGAAELERTEGFSIVEWPERLRP